MTTIVDPSGTPVPIYNRDGTTLSSITGDGSVAPTIQHFSKWDIVLFTAVTGPQGNQLNMPSGTDIGDLIEVHALTAAQVVLIPASGETITGSSSGADVPGDGLLRKVSSTDWRFTS